MYDSDDAVFLKDDDIEQEIIVDEEDLLDVEENEDSDETDDSIHIFTGHTGELYTVAISPLDDTLCATGGGDDKAFVWGIGQGWSFELHGHEDSVSSLAFSRDGKLLASGSFDGFVQVWDMSTRTLKSRLEGPSEGIEWIRWFSGLDGRMVLAGSEDFTVWMWDVDNGTHFATFVGHGGSVTCGEFSPDGELVCTGSDDATMRIWNAKSCETIHVVRGHEYHTEGVTCMAISPDSVLALTGSEDGSVHAVNIVSGKVVASLTAHTGSIECVAFAASSSWAATGGMDGKLVIWDMRNLSARSICEHEEGVTCLSWLGGSRFVATGSVDGKVRVWDNLSGACVKTLSGHSDAIQCLAYTIGGYLVSASLDHTTRVFEITEFI